MRIRIGHVAAMALFFSPLGSAWSGGDAPHNLAYWVERSESESIFRAFNEGQLMVYDAGTARPLLYQFVHEHADHAHGNYFFGFMAAWNIGQVLSFAPFLTHALAEQHLRRVLDTQNYSLLALLEIVHGHLGACDDIDTSVRLSALSRDLQRRVHSPRFLPSGPLTQSWGSYGQTTELLPSTDPHFLAQQHLLHAYSIQDTLDLQSQDIRAFAQLYRSYWRLRAAASANYAPAVDLYWRLVQAPHRRLQQRSSYNGYVVSPPPITLHNQTDTPPSHQNPTLEPLVRFSPPEGPSGSF